MKIFVTGAAGFIGQHLTRELVDAGHRVTGVDKHEFDIRKPAAVPQGFDCVVHLAAVVGHTIGEYDIADTITTNALGTARVAQACAAADIPLAYCSTSEVYGNLGDRTAYEEPRSWLSAGILPQRVLPKNLYGLTKKWGEEGAQLYAPEGLTIFRLSMPYGPGLPAGKGRAAIVNMLAQGQARQTIPVHRGAERSWCWVGDTVRGMRMILESGQGGVWNVGRDDNPTSMRRVAEIACELTGADYELIEEVDAPPNQTVVKRLSTEKLRGLGWSPTVGLEEGMSLTLSWLRDS